MKKLPRLLLVCFLIAASGVFAADVPAPAPAGSPPAAKKKEIETELSQQMDKMSKAFRALRRSVGDAAKNEESLRHVAAIKAAAAASAKLEPYKAGEVPAGDRSGMVSGYRGKMADFAAVVEQLEAALKAGRNDEAAKLVEQMGAMQKEGHREFKSKTLG